VATEFLNDLAGQVLDDAAVDWRQAELNADPSLYRIIQELRLIQTIAQVHRQARDSDGSPPTWNAAAFKECPRLTLGTRWAHLTVRERIGAGANGTVYRAWDARLDREVALKILPVESDSPASTLTIINEGRLLARVRHPNVVIIHGADEIDGLVGLWMELVPGRSLEDLLRERGPWHVDEVVATGVQLSRAVAAVHAAGLLHRDVKTQNVMREDSGRTVLMDFGAGRTFGDEEASGITGTPLYLAPEVFAGAHATKRSDVYGVGVVLYRLLTGSYPVQGRTLSDIKNAHEHGAQQSLMEGRSGLPSTLVAVIERALDRDPAKRFADAGELAQALEVIAEEPMPSATLWRWILAVASMVMAAGALWWTNPSGPQPSELTIAVLPFENNSTEAGSEEFVDGLTDELIRSLAGVEGLTSRGRTSSFFFKGKPRDLQEVSRQLGVNHVVEGVVQRQGGRIRINASLVHVATGATLWSDKFDRNVDDVFAIQDEIARAIVNRLRLTLGRGRRRYEANPQAYQVYLTARGLVDRRGVANMARAAALYEQVIQMSPDFAPAHAGLATAYGLMTVDGGSTDLGLEQAVALMRSAAERAIELDPLDAETHAAMGFLHTRTFDWSTATRYYERAIALNPALTPAYTSFATFVLDPVERYDEARALLDKALERDPLSLDVRRYIGQWQLLVGDYEEAVRTFREVLEKDPSFQYVYLPRALLWAGHTNDALPLLQNPNAHGFLSVALVRTGRRAEAEALLSLNPDPPIRRAFIYTALGDKDRAFEEFERAMVQEPQRLPIVMTWPEFDTLRGDPRLDALRKRLNLPPLAVVPPTR
jgi:serine/threonine protein kinase/tetratricopeptide (TPR) repeat protein